MNKFRNRKTQCLSKHMHDSAFEASYCDRLLSMKMSKEIIDYEVQKAFDLKINNIIVCRHIVDFVVITKEGHGECHEVKGFQTDVWKLKHRMFNAMYPSINYIIISRKGQPWMKSRIRSIRRRNAVKK